MKDRTDYNKKSIQNTVLYLLSENQKSYSKLDEEKLQILKLFGRPLNRFLSDKIVSKKKLTLIEKDEIVESNINTAQILNIFFSML